MKRGSSVTITGYVLKQSGGSSEPGLSIECEKVSKDFSVCSQVFIFKLEIYPQEMDKGMCECALQ